MAPFPFEEARHAGDVGAYEYLGTQITAWWYYVARWIAPVRLVADHLAYPVYRSFTEPVVLLAIGGWTIVAALLVGAWRRAPYLLALTIAALALLSPTSSVAPLAEMVNEHRPYLPIGVLSIALVAGAARLLRHWTAPPPGAKLAIGAGVAAMLAGFSLLTWQRNRVFTTEISYWKDVLDKAPSSRAHLNYGLAQTAAGNIEEGMRHYQRTLELAPFWYFTHINLGAGYQRLGDYAKARHHYDRAVELDRFSGLALMWRGEFRLAQGELQGARDDFNRSLRLSLNVYRNAKGLATAYSALGVPDSSRVYIRKMIALDSAQAMRDIPGVSLPVIQRASQAGARTTPAQQDALMREGLDSLQRGAAAAAASIFRRVIAANPTHYGAHYQLAVALDRSRRRDEGRAVWQKVLQMAESYGDATTVKVARDRLAVP